MYLLLNYSTGYYSYGVRGMGANYLLVIAAIGLMMLGLFAQANVRNTYEKYSKVFVSSGKNAAAVASELLRNNGSSVRVEQISGALTDNFNPRAGCVSLSESVYSSSSVAAVAVAAHECGHVMQYETGYAAIKLRNLILPAASFGSKFAFLLVMVGVIIGSMGYQISSTISLIGVVLFGFVLAFQLLTLPVELDASRRALDMLTAGGYITGAEEENAAKKVLRAAAFTYVIAVLSAAVTFMRLLSIANSNRRR